MAPMSTTAEVAIAAARNIQIQDCRRRIAMLTQNLCSLEEERDKSILCARLRHDACKYSNSLTRKQRHDPDILLAAIESKKPLPFFKYVAKDNYEEGVKFRPPIHDAPFIPADVLARSDIITALMKLADFHEGVEAFIRAEHLRIPMTLNCASFGKELLTSLYEAVPRLFAFASHEMKNDRECVLRLVRANRAGVSCDGSRYVPEEFWNDKEVLMAFLHNPVWKVEEKLKCIPTSSPLRDDIDIARAGLAMDRSHCAKLVFPWLSKRLRANSKVVDMLLDSECGGGVLQHCTEEVRSDKGKVLRFCLNNGEELQYASDSLRADEEVVRAACGNCGAALQYCLQDLRERLYREDPSFIRACIRKPQGHNILKLLPASMQNEESIVLDAFRFKCNEIVPLKLMNDRSFWVKALAKEPASFETLPQSMQDDYELLRVALMNDAGAVFAEMSWCERKDFEDLFKQFPQLLGDKELIMSIVNQGAWHDSMSFSDDFFRTMLLKKYFWSYSMDADFWAALCKHDASCYNFAPCEMKRDKRVVKSTVSADNSILAFDNLPGWAQKNNPKLVTEFMEEVKVNATSKEVFDKFAPEVWSDRNVAKAFAANYEHALLYLPEKYKSDKELVLGAISHSHHAFNSACSSLKSNSSFACMAVMQDYNCFGMLSEELRNDFWLQTLAVASDPEAIHYCKSSGKWGTSTFIFASDRGEGPFDAKVDFARTVRDRIALKESFLMDFLRGIDDPSDVEHNALAALDVGSETALVIKRQIAEYSGIPLGNELKRLTDASENLAVEGF